MKKVLWFVPCFMFMLSCFSQVSAISANPPSNGVSYNKNGQVTVENALDNLYSKANYGDATANDILSGKKALVGGKEIIGTFACPSLVEQTPGTAVASDIDRGKVAWVNGKKIIGTYVVRTEQNNKNALGYRLLAGDYVRYTPTKMSYIISKDDTGHYEDQTINPSELNLWRVIQKNADGSVELVSVYKSSALIAIENQEGYYNLIGTLNKLAKAYETEGYTVGSRHMGYDASQAEEYGNNPDIGYKKDVFLVRAVVGNASTDPIKRVSTSGNYNFQWLASRSNGDCSLESSTQRYRYAYWITGASSDSFTCDWGYKGVVNNRNTNVGQYTIDDGYATHAAPIRPIVVLKSTLKITGGNGTESSPYTLGV